jgi:transposase
MYLQHFITQLYFKPHVRFLSTAGMGNLANKAQKQAIGIVRCVRAIGGKSNCPQISSRLCPASIAPSKRTTFDYWITISSQWKNTIRVPARSHRKLNEKLRGGWALSKHCEVFRTNENFWYVRVFVSKKLRVPSPKKHSVGVDVGISQGVARSDGYLGKSLYDLMRQERDSQRERSRQHHPKKPFKTLVKQQLDIEVNRALVRCQRDSRNLVVEHPKVLSNLRHDRWARSYFARRASERAIEEGVHLVWINPAYTSITCSFCGVIDKRSRVNRAAFRCTSCKRELHADINAAHNIARKGQESLSRKAKAINPL